MCPLHINLRWWPFETLQIQNWTLNWMSNCHINMVFIWFSVTVTLLPFCCPTRHRVFLTCNIELLDLILYLKLNLQASKQIKGRISLFSAFLINSLCYKTFTQKHNYPTGIHVPPPSPQAHTLSISSCAMSGGWRVKVKDRLHALLLCHVIGRKSLETAAGVGRQALWHVRSQRLRRVAWGLPWRMTRIQYCKLCLSEVFSQKGHLLC